MAGVSRQHIIVMCLGVYIIIMVVCLHLYQDRITVIMGSSVSAVYNSSQNVMSSLKNLRINLHHSYNQHLSVNIHQTSEVENQPIITLFTTFMYTDKKAHIHKNTIRLWGLLQPFVHPILYNNDGENNTLVKFARDHGFEVFPVPKTSPSKIPVLRTMYLHAQRVSPNTTFYGYANADIVFDEGLVKTLQTVKRNIEGDKFKQMMIVGVRTNSKIEPGKEIHTLSEVTALYNRKNHMAGNAQDYFISTKSGFPWDKIPDFVVGRVGYDNWLVVHSIVQSIPLIDMTKSVIAIHQTGHDGNKAGHRAKADRYINYKLAPGFDYSLGWVSCSHFYTNWTTPAHKEVTLSHRKGKHEDKNCNMRHKRRKKDPYLYSDWKLV